MDRIPSLHRQIQKRANTPARDGTVLSFTTVRHPPKGFGTEPYRVALIELDDGRKVMAQLTVESPEPTIGARVSPTMRKVRTMENGLIVYDAKYAIVAEKPHALLDITAYVLAVSGPAGVGKTTITRSLLSLFSSYAEQVPIYTTRKPRKNEIEPYKYVSAEEFERMVQSGEIVSSTHMQSASEMRNYGYRKKDIEAIWNSGKLPIVVTEIHLLQGLVKSLGRRAVLSCGLLPPGRSKRMMLSALVHRLRNRGSQTEAQIEERLKIAEADLKAYDDHAHLFDHLVVNDELDACVAQIQELVPIPVS